MRVENVFVTHQIMKSLRVSVPLFVLKVRLEMLLRVIASSQHATMMSIAPVTHWHFQTENVLNLRIVLLT
jgi:hypothetical protein